MRRPIVTVRFISIVVGMLALVLAVLAAPVRAAGPAVIVLPTTGEVDGVMAQYLVDGIARAQREGAPAILVELNTPGGRLDEMSKITGAFLESPVPVIVWVSPAGGRAASAGTFITLAANLAFMAPGTNIGAASPIGSGGEDIPGTLGLKVKNDAIANISAIAQARGRPVDWAASTVSQAKSYSATEAVAAGRWTGSLPPSWMCSRRRTGRPSPLAGAGRSRWRSRASRPRRSR